MTALPERGLADRKQVERISTAGLLARDGWTRAGVQRFLGEPDEWVQNTRSLYRNPMKLYLLSRVESVETTPEWVTWTAKVAKRRANASRLAAEHYAGWKAEQDALAARQRAEVDAYTGANPGLPGALLALHFLNRLVKHSRWLRISVYPVKNEFLRALVEAGLGNVYSFWYAAPSNWNYDYDIDPYAKVYGDGSRQGWKREWFIVEYGEYRFHQPSRYATRRFWERAVPCDPHDPTQPPKELPEIGLKLEQALAVVRAATADLQSRIAQIADASGASVLPALQVHG